MYVEGFGFLGIQGTCWMLLANAGMDPYVRFLLLLHFFIPFEDKQSGRFRLLAVVICVPRDGGISNRDITYCNEQHDSVYLWRMVVLIQFNNRKSNTHPNP